jgi:hypothetical protein
MNRTQANTTQEITENRLEQTQARLEHRPNQNTRLEQLENNVG